MAEQNTEIQNQVTDDELDKDVDSFLDGKETPGKAGSPSEETQDSETEETKDAGADQQKKAESEETKEEESKEDTDPQDKAFREKWNKQKEKLEAAHKKELEFLKAGMLSKEEIENFRKTTSSPAYIRESMRADGYTEEAINARLKELGHRVQEKTADDVAIIAKAFGVNPQDLSAEDRQWAQRQAKAFHAMYRHYIGQDLPAHLQPIQQELDLAKGERESSEIFSKIEKIVEDEDILDYEKDVLPELNKWLDENEKKEGVTRQDFFSFFKDLNHKLSLERARQGKRKEDRENKKGSQRPAKKTANIEPGKAPALTGDVDKDIDGWLDSRGIAT